MPRSAQYPASRFARLARRDRPTGAPLDARAQALATLIGSLPLRVIMVDRELRVLAASKSSVDGMRGHALADTAFVGRSIFDIDPEYFEPFRAICARCLAGESFAAPRVRARKDEGDIWLRTEISPWRDDQGRIGGLISVSIDITDMVETLEQIKRSEARLNVAVEIADLHVWEVDYATGSVVTTGAGDTLFDGSFSTADMVVDSSLSVHPDDRERIMGPWTAAVMANEPFRAEYRINRADDKEVWAATTVKVTFDPLGQPVGMIGAIQNISPRSRPRPPSCRPRKTPRRPTAPRAPSSPP
ncbi:MAG TPA: PAS domain-containing protein [Phenylobacterium sp.]